MTDREVDLKSENEKLEIVFSKKLTESEMWIKLIGMVSTDFVLIGRDIEVLNLKVWKSERKKMWKFLFQLFKLTNNLCL